MQHDNQNVDLRSSVRVLMIDKNPQVARLFSTFLHDEGYEVAVGSRSPDAINMALSFPGPRFPGGAEELVRLVDELLYRAQESGKNRVCIRDG
jgi:CheY-like chemotaxis protein